MAAEAVAVQFLHQRPRRIPSPVFHHGDIGIGLCTMMFFPNEVAPWVLISLDSEIGRVEGMGWSWGDKENKWHERKSDAGQC